MTADFLNLADGRKLAYLKQDAQEQNNQSPTQDNQRPIIVFLAGHGSDMYGSKAEALAAYCATHNHGFLRFDYTGHGLSSGAFLDGTISAWTDDTNQILDHLTDGPVILVGSSLGGWIMLNVAKDRGDKICGLIGIAAAPDFTETLIWDSLDDDQKDMMAQEGVIALPNPYAEEDVIYPYALITDGRDNLLLDKPLSITCPIILHQGMADHEVPWQTACHIAEAVTSQDVTLNIVKSSGHRFSSEAEIAMIISSVEDLLDRLKTS